MRSLATVGLASALLLTTRGPATAQAIPFSQHGTVSQRVGVTDILIEYNRPVARRRTLFGPTGVVRPGRIWHPGADSATRITFNRDVELEGYPIPSGRYTLWLLPAEPGPCTLIVSRAVEVYHTPYPGEEQDVLRTPVPVESGGHMDALAFYFPVVTPDSTTLRLHWGTTIVPIRIRATARE
ncbi:MAG: DUF2911 domain-containing protein [Gemmatimonadales bacterium]